ncbi:MULTISPECIES: hypothetical protein [Bradyrhizobium]|uniref:hypothetical protein n=1 Tax=Bradyrhizobium TaxID=374 RepID=UPI0021672187|nr:hypothetical protein [Bradyrhizobium elkanii]MCS3524562.1 hypothetical protein [Bradyrhizobium elkanii]MCS4072217.1 hypothetical protein [Bradyrhizobium elkanii]MCS4078851.1 hypothetical protein [Bradyrhizobium elkanii]MCW2122551.1 hypothetical protein [Bradyrhizobium elkanii]MCW2169298.1 hypothetical protein [Bradyrhizobium elkanii]
MTMTLMTSAPPFPLMLGDKGLRPDKGGGECVLADAGLLSRRNKMRDQAMIFGRLERFLHRRRDSS